MTDPNESTRPTKAKATVEAHERGVAVLLLLFVTLVYFGTMVPAAWSRALDADETFAVWIVRLIPAARLWDALSAGADSLPPGFYILLKGVANVFGSGHLPMRCASIAAFYVFFLSSFWILRPDTGGPVAVSASALLLLTGAAGFATVARPYSIMAACFGLAAVTWHRSSAGERPRWRAMLIAIPLAVAVFVHFYSVLMAVSFGLVEAIWAWRNRRLRWEVWGALAAGGCSVLAWLPLIEPIYRNTHSSINAPGFYAKPSFTAFAQKYLDLVLPAPISLLLLGVLVFLPPCLLGLLRSTGGVRRTRDTQRDPAADNVYILAVGCLMLPVITFLFASVITGSLNMRYFIAAPLGVSLLAGVGMARLPQWNSVSGCVLVVTVVLFCVFSLPAGQDPRLAVLLRAPEALPVLAAEASDFFVLTESAPHSIRARLVYSGMPGGLQSPDPEPQLVARNWKRLRPDLAVFEAEDFFRRTPEFYVLCTQSPREGMTDWLMRHGGLSVVDRESGVWLFRANADGRWSRTAPSQSGEW
ncbi:MAG: hypothetical protein ACE141_19045 [Bryobacteraceae bacterium]